MSTRTLLILVTLTLSLGAIESGNARVLAAWLVGLSAAFGLQMTTNLISRRREDRLAESFRHHEGSNND